MLHHTPDSATPQNHFETLTDEELARVDGGFIQMLGALLNIAGPLINQFTHKGSRSNGGSNGGSSSSGQGRNQRQSGDQDQGGDQNQAQQSDGSQLQSSGGGLNIGSLLGGLLGGGGMLGGGK